MAKREGGCACGAVRFTVDADPVITGHCQCRHCQQLSGAGHGTFAAFPEPSIKMTGKLEHWSYKADSGNTATRGRCAVCGSPVTGKTSGMPGVVALNLSCFDDPSAFAPQMVFFSAMGQIWDQIDPALPKFPGMPPM